MELYGHPYMIRIIWWQSILPRDPCWDGPTQPTYKTLAEVQEGVDSDVYAKNN